MFAGIIFIIVSNFFTKRHQNKELRKNAERIALARVWIEIQDLIIKSLTEIKETGCDKTRIVNDEFIF